MELTTPIIVSIDGLHTLYWYYMDAEGHTSPIYSRTFGIDRSPPTVSLVKEKIGFCTFRVLIQASDGASGVARLVVYVDDQLRAEIEEEPFEYSWEGSGNHTIRAIAYDYAGFNASSSMTISYEQEDMHQRIPHRRSLFHLQYVLTVSWNGTQTDTPISNGETRMVNVTVQSTVVRGAYGRFLLWLLEGTPYRIHLSVEDTPEWCESWFSPENLSAEFHGSETEVSETSLGIHVSADAPGNYSMGWVFCRASIESLTGPFHVFTLISGFEQNFTITFYNN
jgi:hypothetical protein